MKKEIEILKDVEVGKMYKVPCVKSKGVFVPVIPFLHTDKQFGTTTGAMPHFHVDTRFLDEYLYNYYECSGGRTMRVFAPKHDSDKIIHYRWRKCRRANFGMLGVATREKNAKAFEWYDAQIGKSCKGRLCPHYGVEMVENEKGQLECPLHGIIASIKTLKVIGNVHQGVLVNEE